MKITEKEEIINREFRQFLPGIVIMPLRRGNEGGVNTSLYFIQPENKNFLNSQYFYKGELKFVHFTSLNAIQSILNSKNIRLYNLYNTNDPREYSFAGDLMTFNRVNRKDAKQNMYLFAMCKSSILTGRIEYEFNMWRIYGQNGKGVCIQFDLSSNPQILWKDYFLSEVFYGKSSKVDIEAVNRLLKKYDNEIPKTEIDLGQIVAFHKSNLYSLESEIRLLFDNRENKVWSWASSYYDSNGVQVSPIICVDKTKSVLYRKDVRYLELPIYHENFQSASERIPIPKIEKIFLGHSFINNFENVARKLEKIAESSLGYEIEIEQSRITKYYYENEVKQNSEY
jgi:hypothetical protein